MTDEFGSLELGTIDTVLMRSEASSSSQIEHLTASGKQLALAEIGASKSANARLVQANVAALESASHTHALDTDAVVELQRELLGETGLHIGVRNEQVWIGTSGSSPGWGRVRGAALLPGGGESQRSMGVPQATDNDPGPPPSFGPDGV